jgi:hypothetical protein
MPKPQPKPIAPPDFWDQLNIYIAEFIAPPPPPNSFTREDIEKRHGISQNKANKLVTKLRHDGKIRKYRWGQQTYYILVEAVEAQDASKVERNGKKG